MTVCINAFTDIYSLKINFMGFETKQKKNFKCKRFRCDFKSQKLLNLISHVCDGML